MLSTSTSYPRSADAAGSVHASGLRCFPYSLQDVSDLNCFINAHSYDPRLSLTHPAAIDPQLLLLNTPPVLRIDASSLLSCCSEASFNSSHSHGWTHEPYFGEYTTAEMEASPPGGKAPGVPMADPARSCSPASDSSISDSSSSLFEGVMLGQSPGFSSAAGPSVTSTTFETVLLELPPSSGPIRRGRGRPRKDAPPVYQPPPLCDYVDPLTYQPCGKRLNRHHDLPRHMFKHCQDEAAMVISGRLPRERAILLPADWKESDEMKLPCRYCGATFSRADAVTRHEKREHKRRPRTG